MNKRVIAGLILMAISIACFAVLNRYTGAGNVFSFDSSYKGEHVMLEASIWEKENAEYAVLICPGYSCDRQKWQPFANIFAANGMTVMTFDYAGQGASSGAIGFDNAKTDDVSLEISHAVKALEERTGIAQDHIILLGHSMGGRAILRMLYDINHEGAETTVEKLEIKNVILTSPEVNYEHSTQASLFAGTNDDADPLWSTFGESDLGDTYVYLFGSTADDVVSAGCIEALSDRLGTHVTTAISCGVLHSYQMYSPEFAEFINLAIKEITGCSSEYNSNEQLLTYMGWFSSLAGIYLFLRGTGRGRCATDEKLPVPVSAGRKLVLWIPGLFCALIICSICVLLPCGSPVMNIPYMCFIAGGGIVMLFTYRKQLPKPELKMKKGGWGTLFTAAAVLVYVWFILRSSMYRLVPLNWRLFWLLICGSMMAMGYYVSGAETDALRRSGATITRRFIFCLIQYVPLFIFVLFYLVIGSYSGLIGQIINVLIMYILFIPLGDYVRNGTGSRLAGALFTGFGFQAFMITSAALIAFRF